MLQEAGRCSPAITIGNRYRLQEHDTTHAGYSSPPLSLPEEIVSLICQNLVIKQTSNTAFFLEKHRDFTKEYFCHRVLHDAPNCHYSSNKKKKEESIERLLQTYREQQEIEN